MSRYVEIDREIKKTVLKRLFKHGYSTSEPWRTGYPKFCGYVGVNHPVQATIYDFGIRIDRLFRVCNLVTGTATSINNEMLCDLLQVEEFDIRKTDTADFNDKYYVYIEILQRGFSLTFYNKEEEK